MKILVYGAGVLGSLYAARLKAAGNEVSILARGQRLADIKEHGVVLEHALTGKRTAIPINTVEQLSPEDAYDLLLVVMRKNQVSAVLPMLTENRGTSNILFMVNNASGYDEWVQAVGRDRLILGFPGAGGTTDGHVVRYMIVPSLFQPTTIGEPDGQLTPRLEAIAHLLKQAGFSIAISQNMDAWQKSHVAWVSPLANALYMAGGDNRRLAQMPEAIHLMVQAIREGFQVLRALNIPVTPPKLRLWVWLPRSVLVVILKHLVASRYFEIVIVRHANVARDEMLQLAGEFAALIRQTSIATPAIDQLNVGNESSPINQSRVTAIHER